MKISSIVPESGSVNISNGSGSRISYSDPDPRVGNSKLWIREASNGSGRIRSLLGHFVSI
jgi:hypothetical protein